MKNPLHNELTPLYAPSTGVLDTLSLITSKHSVNSGFSGTLLELFGNNADYMVINNNACGDDNRNEPRESNPYKNEQTESIYGYPNPTSGIFTIQINNSEVNYNILELSSASGKMLAKYDIFGKNSIELHTNEFSNGLYICKLNNTVTGRTIGIKMIVQH